MAELDVGEEEGSVVTGVDGLIEGLVEAAWKYCIYSSSMFLTGILSNKEVKLQQTVTMKCKNWKSIVKEYP